MFANATIKEKITRCDGLQGCANNKDNSLFAQSINAKGMLFPQRYDISLSLKMRCARMRVKSTFQHTNNIFIASNHLCGE